MYKFLSLTLAALIAVMISILAVGCGGDDEASPDSRVVDVSLGEWFVRPDKTSAEAGDITLSARNAGTTLHELVVIKTELSADKLPMKDSQVDEDAAGQAIGEIEEFAAGSTEKATLGLSAGKYVFICNITGHYQLGMHASFTVR